MADIKKELNDIKNAVYGKEVRGSIHDGIKKINDEVENATDLSESAKHQVENIQQQVNQLVVEGDSSVEAAQARVDADNNVYATLKERLDTKETQFSTQLAQKANQLFPTSTVFKRNVDFNANYFRIPFMCITNKGTLIAGSDIRYDSSDDWGRNDIGVSRSEDKGNTWVNKQVIIRNNDINPQYSRAMDGCIIYDKFNDRIYVFAVKLDDDVPWYRKTDKTNWDVVYVYSDDDGKTWSNEISINNVVDEYPERPVFLTGVGSGIVMTDGTIVLPIQTVEKDNPTTSSARIRSGIVYSKDGGITWKMSESILPEPSSECNVVEYEPGKLLINARKDHTHLLGTNRVLYKTEDLGKTWIPLNSNYKNNKNRLYQSRGVMGSTIKATLPSGKAKILYSAPYTDEVTDGVLSRYNITLFYSDDGEKWEIASSIYPGKTQGYSCLVYQDHQLFVLLEIEGDIVFRDISKLLDKVERDSELDTDIPKTHTFYVNADTGSDSNIGYEPSKPLKTIEKAFNLVNFTKGEVIDIYLQSDITETFYLYDINEVEQINIIGDGEVRSVLSLRQRNTSSLVIFNNIKFTGRVSSNYGLQFFNAKTRFINCQFDINSKRIIMSDYSHLMFQNPRFFNSTGTSEVAIYGVYSHFDVNYIDVVEPISTGIELIESTLNLSNHLNSEDKYDNTSSFIQNTNTPIARSRNNIINSNLDLEITSYLNGWERNTALPLKARVDGNRIILRGAINVGTGELSNLTGIAELPKYKPKFEQYGMAIGNISSTEKVPILIRINTAGTIRLGQTLEGLGVQSLHLDGITLEI